MIDEETILALERLIVRSGSITTRAVSEVHPEVRALTVSQYRVLALVASSVDGLRVGELARRSSTRPQAVGRIVQRLETKGLVWSERGAQADRRAVVVRLTDVGRRTWSDISERRRELLRAALEGVHLPARARATLEAIADAFERFAA